MLRSILLLGLIACGGSGPSGSDTSTSTTTGTTPTTGSTTTVTGTATGTPTTDPWGAFEPDFEQELEDSMQAVLVETGAPGVALAVADPTGHRRWVGTAGSADIVGPIPWEPLTPYPIGSVTKLYTAVLILQLIEEGVVSLDDPMDDWVTTPWAGQGITVQQLLQHQTGIASYNWVGGWDGSQPVTPQEMMDWAFLHEPALQFTPGTDHAYSNTGYVILGLIGEEATGQSLDVLFDERFFIPLGLVHTSLADAHPADMVRGYRDDPDRDATDEMHPSAGWAAGGIISTPGDQAAFGAALFSGQLVSEQTLATMTTPLLVDGVEVGYGLGLFGSFDPEWGGNWGHTGGYSGQLTHLYYMERKDRVVVAMVNSFAVDLNTVANAAWYPIWDIQL